MKRMLKGAGALVLLGLLAACGSVLSKDARYQVNHEVVYSSLKQNPDAYQGKTVILGGLILENAVSDDGSTLEILKYSLDRRDEPKDPDEAGGRFLARTDRLLDPSIYKSGRLVTLTGTLIGEEVRPLQQARYRYPVFRIGELYLWPESTPEMRYPYPGYYYPYPYWPYMPYRYRHPYWW